MTTPKVLLLSVVVYLLSQTVNAHTNHNSNSSSKVNTTYVGIRENATVIRKDSTIQLEDYHHKSRPGETHPAISTQRASTSTSENLKFRDNKTGDTNYDRAFNISTKFGTKEINIATGSPSNIITTKVNISKERLNKSHDSENNEQQLDIDESDVMNVWNSELEEQNVPTQDYDRRQNIREQLTTAIDKHYEYLMTTANIWNGTPTASSDLSNGERQFDNSASEISEQSIYTNNRLVLNETKTAPRGTDIPEVVPNPEVTTTDQIRTIDTESVSSNSNEDKQQLSDEDANVPINSEVTDSFTRGHEGVSITDITGLFDDDTTNKPIENVTLRSLMKVSSENANDTPGVRNKERDVDNERRDKVHTTATMHKGSRGNNSGEPNVSQGKRTPIAPSVTTNQAPNETYASKTRNSTMVSDASVKLLPIILKIKTAEKDKKIHASKTKNSAVVSDASVQLLPIILKIKTSEKEKTLLGISKLFLTQDVLAQEENGKSGSFLSIRDVNLERADDKDMINLRQNSPNILIQRENITFETNPIAQNVTIPTMDSHILINSRKNSSNILNQTENVTPERVVIAKNVIRPTKESRQLINSRQNSSNSFIQPKNYTSDNFSKMQAVGQRTPERSNFVNLPRNLTNGLTGRINAKSRSFTASPKDGNLVTVLLNSMPSTLKTTSQMPHSTQLSKNSSLQSILNSTEKFPRTTATITTEKMTTVDLNINTTSKEFTNNQTKVENQGQAKVAEAPITDVTSGSDMRTKLDIKLVMQQLKQRFLNQQNLTDLTHKPEGKITDNVGSTLAEVFNGLLMLVQNMTDSKKEDFVTQIGALYQPFLNNEMRRMLINAPTTKEGRNIKSKIQNSKEEGPNVAPTLTMAENGTCIQLAESEHCLMLMTNLQKSSTWSTASSECLDMGWRLVQLYRKGVKEHIESFLSSLASDSSNKTNIWVGVVDGISWETEADIGVFGNSSCPMYHIGKASENREELEECDVKLSFVCERLVENCYC